MGIGTTVVYTSLETPVKAVRLSGRKMCVNLSAIGLFNREIRTWWLAKMCTESRVGKVSLVVRGKRIE